MKKFTSYTQYPYPYHNNAVSLDISVTLSFFYQVYAKMVVRKGIKRKFQGPKGYSSQMCEVHLQNGNSTTKLRVFTFFNLIPL